MPAFMLVVARMAGIAVAAPFFSAAAVPRRIKTLLVVALSAAVFPLVNERAHLAVTGGMGTVVGGLAGEFALGWLIGFSVAAILMGVQLGIQLASQQAGLALGQIFNPLLESNLPLAAQLYFFISMTIFLGVHGHHALLRALLDSFEVIPLLGFAMDQSAVAVVLDILTVSFSVAVRVGGPIVLALLLALMTLGFVSRTMPQLNILTIGFPLKIGVALIVMALTVMSLETVVLDAITQALDGVRMVLGLPQV
jgi:flagellar biosynthetic protein FliR